MYKIINQDNSFKSVFIEHENGSITSIPFDPANTDYAEYLKWLAEGNTPQPAEQGTQS